MKPCEKTFSPILWERESRQRSDEEHQQIRFRLARMQGKERKGHVTVAVREIESAAESRWCKSHLALQEDRAHTMRITSVLSTAVCGHVFYVIRVGHIWDVWIVRVAVAHTDNSGEEPAPSCECAAVMMNHNS